MSEVFGKRPVTSREFPVLFFDAVGTLLHFQPRLIEFYRAHAQAIGAEKTEEEFAAAELKVLRKLNEDIEQNILREVRPHDWPKFWSEALQLSPEQKKSFETNCNSEFNLQIKWVLPEIAQDVLDLLKQRGYRLAIISNADLSLPEYLRAFGVLGFFESVVTAAEAHAYKPSPGIFEEACTDLDVSAERSIYIGSSYALDVIGAQRAGMHSVLYDPEGRELLALSEENTHGKVVSMEALRHNRRLSQVKLIRRLDELLDFLL